MIPGGRCYLAKSILILLLSYVTVNRAFSQETKMNPDRPDQTEEVHVVPKGRLLIEEGFSVNGFDSGRNALIIRSLIRYGLVKGVELGFLLEQGRERNRYMEETVQSTYPLALRLKIALVEDHAWLPDIAFLGYFQLPFAKDDEGELAHASVSALLAFVNELSDKWKFEYSTGFQQEAFSNKIAWQVYTSLHYKINDKLESFVGSYSQFQHSQKPFHNVDLGLAYKLKENFQVDVAAGKSVGYDERNFFLTAGFSVML
ncbi:MAG TPA: transporter [Flavitalea sp.]|nr:transporter [Flavitalea sp.]